MFIDNCIYFGLRDAPFLFTQFTEFIIRCMRRRGFSRVLSSDWPIFTDSSLSGFGAWFGDDWFAGVWRLADHRQLMLIPSGNNELAPTVVGENTSINFLELWPVVCAIRRWGPRLRGRQVLVMSDNQQVVTMLRTGRSRCHRCMSWILAFICF